MYVSTQHLIINNWYELRWFSVPYLPSTKTSVGRSRSTIPLRTNHSLDIFLVIYHTIDDIFTSVREVILQVN